jgi:hypothetical protein
LFFPAFSPDDIVDHHPNASLVPHVVRPMGMTNASRVPHGHFKVLIVDSGSKVLQDGAEVVANEIADLIGVNSNA